MLNRYSIHSQSSSYTAILGEDDLSMTIADLDDEQVQILGKMSAPLLERFVEPNPTAGQEISTQTAYYGVGSKRKRGDEDGALDGRPKKSQHTTQETTPKAVTLALGASTIERTDTGSTAVASNSSSQAGTSRTASSGSDSHTSVPSASASPSRSHPHTPAATSSNPPSHSDPSAATPTTQNEPLLVATLVPQAAENSATNFKTPKPIIVVSDMMRSSCPLYD